MSKKTNLFIFAGFDKHNIIDDYVVYYLKAINKLGDIIFVYDNSFEDSELSKIKHLVMHSICEKHGEYDFGSYKRGFLWAKEQNILKNYDNLTFCNDSVYGPLYDLKPFYENMDSNQNIDFWSLFLHKKQTILGSIIKTTAIETYNDYLQSYFLVFKKKVFLSDCFNKFISNITNLANKNLIIEKYEINFTKYLLKNGFKPGYLFSNTENDPNYNNFISLIEQGFPFFKRSVFSPINIVDNVNYNQLKDICNKINYPISLFENNYKRILTEYKFEKLKYTRKYKNYNIKILGKKFFRIKAINDDNDIYKIIVKLFGVTIFKKKLNNILLSDSEK